MNLATPDYDLDNSVDVTCDDNNVVSEPSAAISPCLDFKDEIIEDLRDDMMDVTYNVDVYDTEGNYGYL